MKIKRFYANTLREALKEVKLELGSDAVILSNKKSESGIEIVAAIDYDESKVLKPKTLNTASAEKKPFNKTIGDKKPNWLEDLKTNASKVTTDKKLTNNSSQKFNNTTKNLNDKLKEDVVSFSLAKQQRNLKKDPHISESKVNSVLDKMIASDKIAKRKLTDKNFSKIYSDEQVNVIKDKKYQVAEDSQYASDFNTTKVSYDDGTYKNPKIKPRVRAQHKQSNNVNNRKQSQTQTNLEWSQDPMLVSMKDEIKSLKDLLQNQMTGLAWGNFNRNYPHRSELLQRFYKLGLKPSISEAILRQIKETSSLEQGWKDSLSIISKGIKAAEIDIVNEGGVIALVGATGVGKTTTIAKIASRYALQYGSSEIAFVSTDNYRVGAQEQLKTYAQLLQIPVYFASDESELKNILQRLKNKHLVLVDTAGMNHHDIRMTEQLSMLRRANDKLKLFSVLSASAQSSAIHEVSNSLRPYKMDGCIVTKADESTSLGAVMSVIMEQQLPLQYVTDGQKVPEDIHLGRASQLLKRAMGIVRERKDAYDYDNIALSFAGDLLLANG